MTAKTTKSLHFEILEETFCIRPQFIVCNRELLKPTLYKKYGKFDSKALDAIVDGGKFATGQLLEFETDYRQLKVVWLLEEPKDTVSIGVLVHELTHLVMSVFEERGINIEKNNDEVFAYFIQSMLTRALDKYKEAKKKTRR